MRFLRRAINRARQEQAWLLAQAEQRHADAVNRADKTTLERLTYGQMEDAWNRGGTAQDGPRVHWSIDDAPSSPVDATEGTSDTPEPPEATETPRAPKWRTP